MIKYKLQLKYKRTKFMINMIKRFLLCSLKKKHVIHDREDTFAKFKMEHL